MIITFHFLNDKQGLSYEDTSESNPLYREVKNGYPVRDIAGFRNVVFISIDADELDKQETPKSGYSFKSIKNGLKTLTELL